MISLTTTSFNINSFHFKIPNKKLGVTSINCSIYKVDIYNPIPTFEYPEGWYSYVGMTTKDDWHDRIEEHKIESKKNNPKFYTIRERSNKPWRSELIDQWNMPFIDPSSGLRFMSPAEQYYIKKYKTFGTTYGLNNSIGGDYGTGLPNTSGVKGLWWARDERLKSKGTWVFNNGYIKVTNQDLRLLLYQVRDQFKQEINILSEERLKQSLQISDRYKYSTGNRKYYCGASHITMSPCEDYKKGYRWRVNYTNNGNRKFYDRADTFDIIREFGHEIHTHILFAYQAIAYENEWLIDQYTVDEDKFMPFREFEKKYTIKDNDQLKKVILDNIIE